MNQKIEFVPRCWTRCVQVQRCTTTKFRRVFAIAVAAACVTACMIPQTDFTGGNSAILSAQPCCGDYEKIQYQAIPVASEQMFSIDQSSPAFAFEGTGLSYFKAFAIPNIPEPYTLQVRSYLLYGGLRSNGGKGEAFFVPRVTLLDQDKKVVLTTTDDDARFSSGSLVDEPNKPPRLQVTVTIKPEQNIRYVVVHTANDVIGAQRSIKVNVGPPGVALLASAFGADILNYTGSAIASGGKLKIQLKRGSAS